MNSAVVQDETSGGSLDTKKVFKSQDRLMHYVEHLLYTGHSEDQVRDYFRTMIMAFSPHRETAPTPARAG